MEKWSSQRIRELMTPIALRGMAGNKIGCARISMMVRSMSSNTRPDTLMQDRTLQAYRFLLQRTAGPYIGVIFDPRGRRLWVTLDIFGRPIATSALAGVLVVASKLRA